MGTDGVAVRCAVCRYVFRVDGRADAAVWRIRTVDGDLFEAEDLPTLRVWVREGRLHPDDTISRTGKHWIRLGDMPEFSDAFAGFPDLPEVLSAPGGGPLPGEDLGAVGPPPSYGGDDVPTEVSDAVRPTARAPSERLDMSGLFALPESSDDIPAVPDDLSERTPPSPSEDTVTVAPGAISRTSAYEDSASMVLDDLVAPQPDPDPDVVTEVALVSEVSGPRRKAKHQTKKVQTLVPSDELVDDGPVARVVDPDGVEPEPDAAQPRSASPGPSMLGAVTAHVRSGPVRPIAGPMSARAEPEPDPEPAGVALETIEPRGPRRASWPLFAGLGILCGAAVVFGIPQIRQQVLGTGPVRAQDPAVAQPAAIKDVDAAVRDGRLAALGSAVAAAASPDALPVEARADLALAVAEARAAVSVSLRLQALHDPDGDAGFRADDAAEAAAQAFGGVDVDRATPRRLARTRARVRLAQGRPQDEVLPLVPDDEPELRALVLGAQLWLDPGARVPSGLISTLSGLEAPSVPARVLLATAYARGGDEVGAQGVREALRAQAADDPTVRALLSKAADVAAVAEPDATAGQPATGGSEGGDEETSAKAPEAQDEPAEPNEPKGGGMSTDKLISRGCEKVEGGDVSGGLKMLLKAFDRRPNDLDVLVCLGTANRKKGVPGTALRYYERALKRSPKFMPALLGAARTATKLGSDDKALTYYRRVLAVSPSNAEAKSYVAKKNAPTKKPTPPSGVNDGRRKPEPPGNTDARKPEPPKPAP